MIEEVIDFYEEEAKVYESSRYTRGIGKLIDTLHKEKIHRLFEYQKGDIVLDIGTGTGRFALDLVDKDAYVVAFDPTESMLVIAKEKSKKVVNQSKIHFILSDGHFFPFRRGSFHWTTSINVLCHIKDYQKIIAEIAEVLNPNGKLIANFPIIHSIYFPIGFFVRLFQRATFSRVYSHWFSLKEINESFLMNDLVIEAIEGYSPLVPPPLLRLTSSFALHLLTRINNILSNTFLKLLSGNIFVRGQIWIRQKQ